MNTNRYSNSGRPKCPPPQPVQYKPLTARQLKALLNYHNPIPRKPVLTIRNLTRALMALGLLVIFLLFVLAPKADAQAGTPAVTPVADPVPSVEADPLPPTYYRTPDPVVIIDGMAYSAVEPTPDLNEVLRQMDYYTTRMYGYVATMEAIGAFSIVVAEPVDTVRIDAQAQSTPTQNGVNTDPFVFVIGVALGAIAGGGGMMYLLTRNLPEDGRGRN